MGSFGVPVRNYMTTPAVTVGEADRLEQVRLTLEKLGISAVGVVSESGALKGVLSRSDLLRVGRVSKPNGGAPKLIDLPEETAREVMATDPITIGADEPVSEAARLMVKHHVHRLFVSSGDDVLGVISTRDLMQVIEEQKLATAVRLVGTSGVVGLQSDQPVSLALDRMQAAHVHGVVVMETGWPVGVFAQPEALLAREADPTTPVGDLMNPAVLTLPEEMPIHRAAHQAMAMRARRVVLTNGAEPSAILSGLDFARAVR